MALRRDPGWASARRLPDHVEAEADAVSTVEQHQLLVQAALPPYLEEHPRVRRRFLDVDEVAPAEEGTAAHKKASSRWWKRRTALARLSYNLIKADHRFFNVPFVYRRHESRPTRVFLAWATLVLIFWAEAVAALYVSPYRLCEGLKSEHNCLEAKAPTGLFTSRGQCEWHENRDSSCRREPCDKCRDRDPSASQETLENSWEAFICVLVALPCVLLFEYERTERKYLPWLWLVP